MSNGILNRELFIRFSLLALSLLLVFVGGEFVCRLFFPDTQLRYTTDSESLYYLEPNQVGMMSVANGTRFIPARINNFGFRGPDIKEGSQPLILVLGDSFTLGAGVQDHETFSALLDTWLGSKGVVVNGGQPGYGTFQMAATLQRVGDRLRPQLVVVVLWQGDFMRQPLDSVAREEFFAKKRRLEILKTSVLLTHIYRRVERALLHFGADRFVLRLGEGGMNAGLNSVAIVDTYLRGLEADLPRLAAMHQQATRYGDGIFLVLWPKEDFATQAEEGLADLLTNRLGTFAREHKIPFISVQPAMRQWPPSFLLIPNDWHPTALAHCLAAKRIAAELMTYGLHITKPMMCHSVEPSPERPLS